MSKIEIELIGKFMLKIVGFFLDKKSLFEELCQEKKTQITLPFQFIES